MEPFWEQVSGRVLRQGDYLLNCPVPLFMPESIVGDGEHVSEVEVKIFNLIVLTQSCDLENQKARLVALSPIYSLSEFESLNSAIKQKGQWEVVRQGRREGLILLGSPNNPANNRESLVVDFREIYSLPFGFISDLAAKQGTRWRLKSPYLEHFSQAFARFFMRVGLPSSIPPFK